MVIKLVEKLIDTRHWAKGHVQDHRTEICQNSLNPSYNIDDIQHLFVTWKHKEKNLTNETNWSKGKKKVELNLTGEKFCVSNYPVLGFAHCWHVAL